MLIWWWWRLLHQQNRLLGGKREWLCIMKWKIYSCIKKTKKCLHFLKQVTWVQELTLWKILKHKNCPNYWFIALKFISNSFSSMYESNSYCENKLYKNSYCLLGIWILTKYKQQMLCWDLLKDVMNIFNYCPSP